MSSDLLINTANTLSINSSPGEQKRYPSLAQDSVFSFGDFKIHRDLTPTVLSAETAGYSFSSFSTLSSMSADTYTFDAHKIININENELNIKRNNVNSYSFFGSFYTKIASSINSIIENFPYAILSYDYYSGTTIMDYINNYNQTSSFSIPVSALTNQAEIIYASGYTRTATAKTELNLFTDFTQFAIMLSSVTSSTTISDSSYEIKSYYYDYTNSKLTFEVEGYVFSASTSASTLPIYIIPTPRRFYQYKNTISDLEYQLLFSGEFLVPDTDSETFERRVFEWPKTIDGFNPDTYGNDFEQYKKSILTVASLVDDIKTNWMVRTMVPENYIELDSDGMIYRKLINVYAEEFDKIKKYIDNLSYSHTVNYQNEEAIPDKFISRLSKLLGWEPINEFTDSDIFDYLVSEDSDGYTKEMYNHELWKKILISINWLYKKKGTRDSLQFIFKLMGAPDCLINFNEFIYKINQAYSGTTNGLVSSDKIKESTGYINYNSSEYIFQEGGEGRGNGDNYITQWKPEFNPLRTVDNIKVQTGETDNYGTEQIVNTKEVEIDLGPAQAIECDIKKWYELNYADPYVAELETPPSSITGWTLQQWLEYVYTSTISPKNHKVIGYIEGHHSYHYPNLRNVYLTYFNWNIPNQISNQLTFAKLDKFIELINRHFYDYVLKLIPATTILDGAGVTYRNTLFNRQKFVYPPGINDGSEFQIIAPLNQDLIIHSTIVNSSVNDIFNFNVNATNVVAEVAKVFEQTVHSVEVLNEFSVGYNLTVNAVSTTLNFQATQSLLSVVTPDLQGQISGFPSQMVPQPNIPNIAVQYRTLTWDDISDIDEAIE